MGKYDDLFDEGATPSPTPSSASVGKYADLFDEPSAAAAPSPTPATDAAASESFLGVLSDIYQHGGERLRRMHEPLAGEHPYIAGALKAFDERYANAKPAYPKELCYLFGEHMEGYVHDMKICQKYAQLNRATIADTILFFLGSQLSDADWFETIHNYINFEDGIMRKGAVSAQAGEKLIIPMNMRDGSLICVGKGNEDWNFSAPHGAGRIMSRGDAKHSVKMDDYNSSMEGIYTSCVSEETIDESPMAYKPMEEIIANIGDTVTILERVRPIYNFKASE